MVRKIHITFALIFLLMFEAFLLVSNPVQAQVVCSNKDDCQNKIKEYEEKLNAAREQKSSLTSQLQLIDTRSELAQVRIQKTQHGIETTRNEIEQLTGKIEQLNTTLDHLSVILLQKIVQGYKNKGASMLDVLLSPEASTLTNQLKYIQIAQENDRLLALRTQQVKVNFSEQKTLREDKKTELEKLEEDLEAQKIDLKNQSSQKKVLLEQTKGNEKTYQILLERARAEYSAIQTIVTVGSNESLLRDVTKGEKIASIIPGASCNSGGGHLHFITKDGDVVTSPFSYLGNISSTNCSGSSCGSSDGDLFNPSGSWDWPISGPIQMNQGYGNTWAARNTWVGQIYSFHNGIDIVGSSLEVRAVSNGTLYRGGFRGQNGCTLPYVKLVHKDSSIQTYYLHVL